MANPQYQNYSFSAILYAVSSSADIPAPIILSKSRNIEVVDARHILISILSECGWHQARIARQLGTSEALYLLPLTASQTGSNLAVSSSIRHSARLALY